MRSAERQPSRSRAPSQAEGKCAVAGNELFPFSVFTVPPARSDGMDHILAGQSISLRDFCTAGFAAAQRLTLGKQLRSCSPMDAAVNTAASQKRAVRRVDNSIHFHLCDVVSYNLKGHNTTRLSTFQNHPSSLSTLQWEVIKITPYLFCIHHQSVYSPDHFLSQETRCAHYLSKHYLKYNPHHLNGFQ